MQQIILDTSFILTAVKQKVDFFEKIEYEGFKVLIPQQVFRELRGLGANLAQKIIEQNKFKLLKIDGKDADEAIINFTKKNPTAIVATMDQELSKKIKNPKMIIRQLKRIEVV